MRITVSKDFIAQILRFNYILFNVLYYHISKDNSSHVTDFISSGGTINSETSLKDFFYPETGIYRFKPGEGLSRCTRYVAEDLASAFPCTIGTLFTLLSYYLTVRVDLITLNKSVNLIVFNILIGLLRIIV